MAIHKEDIFDPDGYRRFRAFGPFIDPDAFEIMPTTYRAIAAAGVIFGLSMVFAISAAYLAVQQARNSRRPSKSIYVWMIWIELAACVIIAIECLFYLLYIIPPSFHFFMSILILWSIQIHLLPQIIINRIRVILYNRNKGRAMIISVALVILCINISVFCIWIPARLQVNNRYIHINNIWDRVEKVVYLLVDACLNWYFIRTVKKNLVANGLQRYNRLVRFNQRIIIVSLLMDVMIICALSIPNGFLYAMFHPLAFLVKLNIEMTMVNLIRCIALSNQTQHSLPTIVSKDDCSGPNPATPRHSRWIPAVAPKPWSSSQQYNGDGDGIVKTEEYSVVSQRRSQISAHLLQWGGQKVKVGSGKVEREDNLVLEDAVVGSGEAIGQRVRGSSASDHGGVRRDRNSAAGDEVILVAPPLTVTRTADNA